MRQSIDLVLNSAQERSPVVQQPLTFRDKSDKYSTVLDVSCKGIETDPESDSGLFDGTSDFKTNKEVESDYSSDESIEELPDEIDFDYIKPETQRQNCEEP
jgi:hypothetical protein